LDRLVNFNSETETKKWLAFAKTSGKKKQAWIVGLRLCFIQPPALDEGKGEHRSALHTDIYSLEIYPPSSYE
jgi:hypothetical protein